MQKKIKKAKHMQEYSKKVIAAMVLLWFISAAFGICVITYQLFTTPEYVNLDSFFNYIGLPLSGGVVGYLIKSAVENKQKIKKGGSEELPQEIEREEIENV